MRDDVQTAPKKVGLSAEDARLALKHKDPEQRAYATMRLAKSFKRPDLTASERAYAERLLDIISKDVSELVRRALAVTLKNSPFLPTVVLQRLTADIESIAVPVIEHSPLLTEDDLRRVLDSGLAGKVRAVSTRTDLTHHIILTLIQSGDAVAVRNIAANDSVTLSEDAAAAMADIYREDDEIRTAMMRRAAMPMAVVEKLVTASANDIVERLEAGEGLTRPQSRDIGQGTYQRTMTALPNAHFKEKALRDLVSAMQAQGRLTSDIILRAMGVGQMAFVHYGLAARADISVRKVVLMLHDTGPFALKGVCQKAGLNADQTLFMQFAIRLYTDLERQGQKVTEETFQMRLLERILTLPMMERSENADYFLNLLDSLSQAVN
jgi:uncharacterized protein (DUF2336 family)